MGERTSHPPGTISWTDLVTSDLDAAKGFYGSLLGWTFEDMPVGDGNIYSMASVGGRHVAAVSADQEQPPHWNLYVTVASADAAAARAGELGATVLAPPFDVLDAGRMAVVQDPTGAILCPWEPRLNIGAQLVNAPGALTWADITTPDPDAAARFYGDWLGWTLDTGEFGPDYRVIRTGGRTNGGVTALPPDQAAAGVPPHWYPYLGTEDLEAAVAAVGELGGRTVVEPTETPVGSFAVVIDPQGADFALWGGRYDD